MNVRPNSDPIYPTGDLIVFNQQHRDQNESSQGNSNIFRESFQSESPTEFSTENNEFLYLTDATETVTDTNNSTAVICGQQSIIPTTATTLDEELHVVCGQCEKVLIELPCETSSKIQEQVESYDYPDVDKAETKTPRC